MRNFYNQQPNKILDKMFGKPARQIQADLTLDLTKCNCCNCGSPVGCKGCMIGDVIKSDSGCCPSSNESLIFEHQRPGGDSFTLCCNQNPPNIGSVCCQTTRFASPNLKWSYHYVGQYFRMDYESTGNIWRNGGVSRWPFNNLPRLCSYCDASSHRYGVGNVCKCKDLAFPFTQDDPANLSVPICTADACPAPFEGCECMGYGPRRVTDRWTKRMSAYRKQVMEKTPYWKWLADVMCYDQGNIFRNPWTWADNSESPNPIPEDKNGSLYHHLLGVVHCEHWWEIDLCDQNPNINLEDEGFQVNPSCMVPRFWIQACSGVPVFDFEVEDAVSKGYLDLTDIQELWSAVGSLKTPNQGIMKRMAQGGYFDTGDWRQEASKEIKALRGFTFTRQFYPEEPKCSQMEFLGPVRKRYFDYESNIPGWTGAALLSPNNARTSTLQLPAPYRVDPWKELGKRYPRQPGPDATQKDREEYEAFLAWKDSQWVYMHARPGGWDYVCAAYYNGDPTVKIPDLPRRFMTQEIVCADPEESQGPGPPSTLYFEGCLASLLGMPTRSQSFSCGINVCGYSTPQLGCDAPCFEQECSVAQDSAYCPDYPEQGGGNPGCGSVLADSTCEGLSLVYSRQSPIPCGEIDDEGNIKSARWVTNRIVKAALYKVNITNGNYSSFCPYICRNLTIPKPVSTNFANIRKSRPAFRNACRAANSPPSQVCGGGSFIPDGKYCFGSGCFYYRGSRVCDETESCSATWCPSDEFEPPYNWGPDANCCRKNSGPTILMPQGLGITPIHPAFSNVNCRQCGPGNIYSGVDCSSLGCCFDCCAGGEPTFVKQSECYKGYQPDDPEVANLFWIPSVNGINCSNNSFNCPPSKTFNCT